MEFTITHCRIIAELCELVMFKITYWEKKKCNFELYKSETDEEEIC